MYNLLSVGGRGNFPRFSATGWRVAWKPGPSDPVNSHPKPRFPAPLAGAWSGSQVPRPGYLPPEASFEECGSQVRRTRSHRFLHQPDGPLATTRRAPDPVMPHRCADPMAATVAGARLSPPDCQRAPSASKSSRRRAVRQEVGPRRPPRFDM